MSGLLRQDGAARRPYGSNRIPSLDGLRAVSITLVIVFHLWGMEMGGAFAGVGNLGVRIFFVISGFLITGLLFKELDATGHISLKRFYIRRALRIFPAFYVFWLAIYFASASGFITVRPRDLTEAATYTINYFAGQGQSVYVKHIWSLSVEEQFYLLWPILLCYFGKRRGLSIAGCFMLIAPLIRIYYWFFVPGFHELMDRRFETVADAIAAGCLLAGTQSWLATCSRYNSFLRSKWFYTLPVLLYLDANFLAGHPRIYLSIGQTVLNLGIACCIDRWVRFPEGLVADVLNAPAVRQIGLLSYSIYLWQQPFMSPDSRLFMAFPLNLIPVFLLSAGSFYLIERPFQSLKSKLSAPRRLAATVGYR